MKDRHWNLTDDLRVDPALGVDGEDVEAGEDEGVVPVQGVAVPGRVLLALPRAEVRQEVVDVVGAVQVRRIFVQDLEALENELDPVA